MDPQRLRALLTKYQNGDATDEERALVEAWYETLDDEAEDSLSASEKRAFIEAHWQQLSEKISDEPKIRWMPTVFYRVAAAAVVVLSIGLGWYFMADRPETGSISTQVSQSKLIDKTNDTNRPLALALSDGSTITLKPGSQVQYPAEFAANRREVRLVGEAFFEIAKNPERPFLVYANGMVTKVLGTSFNIIARAGKPTAEVVVRTGRVAVYRQTDAEATSSDIVLTPNEKATFYRAESRIVKSLADRPVVLRPAAIKTHFIYNDTPLAEVFRELNDVYGVTISFDKQTFSNCTLTANLANQPLPVQLNMICLSIGATYRTSGTAIQISGRGCF